MIDEKTKVSSAKNTSQFAILPSTKHSTLLVYLLYTGTRDKMLSPATTVLLPMAVTIKQ